MQTQQCLSIKNQPARHYDLFSPLLSIKGSVIEIDPKLEQRGIAEVIEATCVEIAKELYGDTFIRKSSRKSVEDFIVKLGDIRYIVDVKAHDLNGSFSMPNLTAVEIIRKIYNNPITKLYYLVLDYVAEGAYATITDVKICAPHDIQWNSLQVANLGKGQLQVKHMDDLLLDYTQDRERWLSTFVKEVVRFKHNLIDKITKSLEEWHVPS